MIKKSFLDYMCEKKKCQINEFILNPEKIDILLHTAAIITLLKVFFFIIF